MQLLDNLMQPARAFRRAYLPLVMVYFAYGALGLIDVSRDMWVKESLSLTPAELAGIGVWLTLPWTVKMVFGQLVDGVPIFGSQRKSYIVIGAAFTAAGLVTLAGAAGRWLSFLPPDQLFVLGATLIVIGIVIQDVVADAMSTEVVSRRDEAGHERPEQEFRAELGMVQVLGRLALSAGILAVEAYHAGLVRSALYSKDLQDAARAISNARDSLDGKGNRDQPIGTAKSANITPTDGSGIAFSRSAGEVLNVVYLNPKSVTKGGFFPKGVNGAINKSA